MQAVAAIKKETPLSVEEAIKLLRRDDVIYTAVPPSQPKAGEVYLFRPDKDINVGKFRTIKLSNNECAIAMLHLYSFSIYFCYNR